MPRPQTPIAALDRQGASLRTCRTLLVNGIRNTRNTFTETRKRANGPVSGQGLHDGRSGRFSVEKIRGLREAGAVGDVLGRVDVDGGRLESPDDMLVVDEGSARFFAVQARTRLD